MKELTITQLEEELGVNLPADYRQLLTDYPNDLSTANYFDDPLQGGPSDFELLMSTARIRELNRRERKRWPQGEYAHVPLPDSFVFIGSDGNGNLFAIDTAVTTRCPVLEFDHELPDWQEHSSTLQEFVQHLRQCVAALRKA